jgi:hypothetical protein
MSLSRTVPVKEHQIQVLLKDLRRELRHQQRVSAECKRIEVFVNDDRTRTFLALALQEPSQVSALPPDRARCPPILCEVAFTCEQLRGPATFSSLQKAIPARPPQVVALIRQVDAAFSLNRLPQFYQVRA